MQKSSVQKNKNNDFNKHNTVYLSKSNIKTNTNRSQYHHGDITIAFYDRLYGAASIISSKIFGNIVRQVARKETEKYRNFELDVITT